MILSEPSWPGEQSAGRIMFVAKSWVTPDAFWASLFYWISVIY